MGLAAVSLRDPDSGKSPKAFTFDHAYADGSEQQQVFEDLGKDIVDKALEGYNLEEQKAKRTTENNA